MLGKSGWMNGWMNEWTNERTNERTNKRKELVSFPPQMNSWERERGEEEEKERNTSNSHTGSVKREKKTISKREYWRGECLLSSISGYYISTTAQYNCRSFHKLSLFIIYKTVHDRGILLSTCPVLCWPKTVIKVPRYFAFNYCWFRLNLRSLPEIFSHFNEKYVENFSVWLEIPCIQSFHFMAWNSSELCTFSGFGFPIF